MKKKRTMAATFVLALLTAGFLAGCGANLDREVVVEKMILEVPSEWLEQPAADNNEKEGEVSFIDEDDDRDIDETGDRIVVSYQKLDQTMKDRIESAQPLSASAKILEMKKEEVEKEYGVIAWDIDDEETRVIEGAQVTIYEYSFVKEIDHVRHKYEYDIAYVLTPDMLYEIDVVGDKANINAVIDTIEFQSR